MRFSMNMWFKVLIAFAVVVSALGQGDFVSQCPSPNGYFADSVQCDKYYDCVDDVLTEKLCPDGMAFNDFNPRIEKCDFIFQIDCDGRPELQPPRATEVCPRQNGYYPVAEEGNCHQFHYCAAGVGNLISCPEGLAFSLKTGNCVWPEEAGRANCISENVLNFTCPTVHPDAAAVHPRYADPKDCQFFYVCINGKTPRRNGCSFGEVFNSLTTACGPPTDVPECADYYTEYFENYFNTLGDSNGRISADIIAAAITSGFHVPNLNDRQRIHSPKSQKRGTTEAPGALDAFRTRTRGTGGEPPKGLPAARPGSRTKPHRLARPTGGTSDSGLRGRPAPRPAAARPAAARPAAARPVRTRLTTARPTTTTAPPPPADDYVYYDDAVYYDDYPAEAAPAPATTSAPTTEGSNRSSSFRRTLVKPRT